MANRCVELCVRVGESFHFVRCASRSTVIAAIRAAACTSRVMRGGGERFIVRARLIRVEGKQIIEECLGPSMAELLVSTTGVGHG